MTHATGDYAGDIVGVGRINIAGESHLELDHKAAWLGGTFVSQGSELILSGDYTALIGDIAVEGLLTLGKGGALTANVAGSGSVAVKASVAKAMERTEGGPDTASSMTIELGGTLAWTGGTHIGAATSLVISGDYSGLGGTIAFDGNLSLATNGTF